MESNKVTIQVLGGGDAFGSGGNFQTSFYVKSNDFHFLVDCGATTVISMKRKYVSPSLIDTILLTHLHGDHFSGIPFFLLDAQNVQKRKEKLNIIGPEGTEEKVFQVLALLYPGIDPKDFSYYIQFKEYSSKERFQTGPLHIETFPVVHAEGSKPHGLRVRFENKILAFSGDTTWDDILYSIAENADFFMCECNFFDTPSDNHIHYQKLLENKKKLSCKKMVLNHLGEEMLFERNNIEFPIAEEGEIFEV